MAEKRGIILFIVLFFLFISIFGCGTQEKYTLENHPKLTQSIRDNGFSQRSVNNDGTISLLIFFNDNVSKDKIRELSNKHGEFVGQEPAGSGYIIQVREDYILDFINNKEVRWVEEVGPPPGEHETTAQEQ